MLNNNSAANGGVKMNGGSSTGGSQVGSFMSGMWNNIRGQKGGGGGQNGVGYRGPMQPQQPDMYNGYTPHTGGGKSNGGLIPNGTSNTNGGTNINGTYSSHPNLVNGGQRGQNGGLQHRRLPPLPNKPSALKVGQWRQSSLPEEHNPPGYHRKTFIFKIK